MKKANYVVILILTIFTALVFYLSSQLPDLSSGSVTGPEFFPNLLAITLVFLLVLLFISTVRMKENTELELLSPIAIKTYKTMVIILTYLLAMNYLGFIVSTVILLFVLLSFLGRFDLIKNLIISVGATAVIYIIFKIILSVPIPSGFFIG